MTRIAQVGWDMDMCNRVLNAFPRQAALYLVMIFALRVKLNGILNISTCLPEPPRASDSAWDASPHPKSACLSKTVPLTFPTTLTGND